MKIFLSLLLLFMSGSFFEQSDKYEARRNQMVKTQIQARGITGSDVTGAMRKVPRHLFVPEEYIDKAYDDYPLPIGYGQTISQPYIVAYMTAATKPSKKKIALEIGTGSGYQAAVLAELVEKVYTIEIVPELAKESSERFKQLGITNIISKCGDGYQGWKEYAPYDLIVVTAAPEKIPQPLIDQLSDNGRMVIPVGKPSAVQELILITRKNGNTEQKRLTFVRFVPFRRL